jgi:FtsP/CotA-like multicopper oxidase with cupredoxin domain
MCRFLLVALLLGAALAHAGERGEPGHEADDLARLPMVVDAQGKTVGPLKSFSDTNGVYLAIDGEPVFVSLSHKLTGPQQYSASEFVWTTAQSVGYASTDCGGGPLVPYSGSPTPAIAVREGADVTVYVAVSGYSGNVHVLSLKQTDSSGVTSCSATPFDEGALYWAVRSTYPLTQHYPEPLHIVY